jgi:hypothetical protein
MAHSTLDGPFSCFAVLIMHIKSPLIIKAYLETKPNDLVPTTVPGGYSRHGYYPTGHGVNYDEVHGDYVISLEGLVLR